MNDRRFGEPEGKFTLAVPVGYRHRSQIDTFVKRMHGRKETQHISENLTSENLSRVTTRLVAGKLYEVSFIPVCVEHVGSAGCLAYLESQHALLVGAQGLTLARLVMPKAFPLGWVYSLDKKVNLFADKINYQIPFAHRYPSGLWDIGLGDWADGLNEGEHLMLVREAPPI